MSKMFNLNNLMQKHNITQINLSMEIGITQETISAYLNGKAKPSADVLIKLADFFNTSIDYLLERTNIDIPISNVKPSNLTDTEFNIINTYRSLNASNKTQLQGYIDALKDVK